MVVDHNHLSLPFQVDEENLESDQEEVKLGELVFDAHTEMPRNVMNHFPSLMKRELTSSPQTIHELSINGDDVGLSRIMVVDDEPFNIDSIKVVL